MEGKVSRNSTHRGDEDRHMTEMREQGDNRPQEPQEQRGESSIERGFVSKGLSVFRSLGMNARNVKLTPLI